MTCLLFFNWIVLYYVAIHKYVLFSAPTLCFYFLLQGTQLILLVIFLVLIVLCIVLNFFLYDFTCTALFYCFFFPLSLFSFPLYILTHTMLYAPISNSIFLSFLLFFTLKNKRFTGYHVIAECSWVFFQCNYCMFYKVQYR